MKTQLTARNDVSCLSEFDPALMFQMCFQIRKLVLDLIRAYNLRFLQSRKLSAH